MKQLEYTIRFNTPAFLGNAEQQGQWRTPPFKALIRQWWRVAYAEAHRFPQSTVAMRREEGLLFGNAWLSHREQERDVVDHCKSLVRIRLDTWEIGKLKSWDGLEQGSVRHPETERTGYKVGPHAYLGFGPLDGRGGTKLSTKTNAAIQYGESATLAIAMPDEVVPHIQRALWLMDRYASAGGRSRNGWGSFALLPSPASGGGAGGEGIPLRPWRDALALDWPHAIGQDEKGALIWQTRPFDNWKPLMRELAVIKIGLRTQFNFTTGKYADHPDERHWLSHPVTNHNVAAWKEKGRGDFRLPNSLRFKVRKTAEGKLVGVVFHVPCLPPPMFKPDRNAIQVVWQNVHALLDELVRPNSERAYQSVADAGRRAQLKSSLDTLTLQRISE